MKTRGRNSASASEIVTRVDMRIFKERSFRIFEGGKRTSSKNTTRTIGKEAKVSKTPLIGSFLLAEERPPQKI